VTTSSNLSSESENQNLKRNFLKTVGYGLIHGLLVHSDPKKRLSSFRSSCRD